MTPLNPDFADAVRASFARQQIMNLIGAELGTVEPGIVEIGFRFRPELTQHKWIHSCRRAHYGRRFRLRLRGLQFDACRRRRFKC